MSVWDSEDTAARAEILLLALELPGRAAGREGGRERTREGGREGTREGGKEPGREGGSATAARSELGVLPPQFQLPDLPRLLHLSLLFFTSRDAPAVNSPYWALFLPWKCFSSSQKSLMCTPCLSHSLQGMPQGNNPQAQIQGPCINHIPTILLSESSVF